MYPHIRKSELQCQSCLGGYLNKSFIDFFLPIVALSKIKSFVCERWRAMPAMRATTEIRPDAFCDTPFRPLLSFYCFVFLFSVSTSVAFCSFSLVVRLPLLFLSAPSFCGWQSPWDYAHSEMEILKRCPNTSFQGLPGEIPHGCLYAADLPVCLPLTSARQLLSCMNTTR